MSENNYWSRFTQIRTRRRTLLRSGAAAGIGGLALSLIGCGGSGNNNSSASSGGSASGSSASGSTAAASGSSSGASGATGASGAKSGLLSPLEDSTAQATRGGIMPYYSGADTPGFTVYPAASSFVGFHNDRTYSKFVKNKVANLAKGEKPTSDVEGDAFSSIEMSPDGLTITMKLRTDTAFDPRPPTNGRKLTMDDVNYSWKQFSTTHRSRGQIVNSVSSSAPVTSMTTPDATTVVFKLAFPSPSLLPTMAYALNAPYIYPTEADGGYDPAKDMRGSGPWTLDKYEPSATFQYRRNPNYYDKNYPILDGIDLPIVSDYATQLSSFRAGHIYTVPVNTQDVIQTKKDLPQLQMIANPFVFDLIGAIWFDFLPNHGSLYFDDRVRNAMSMTIDRDTFINQLYNVDAYEKEGLPVSKAWNSVIPLAESEYWLDPQGKNFGDNAKYFQLNIPEAQKLISAAIGKDKLESDWTVVSGGAYGADYEQQAQVLQGMFNAGPFNLKYVGEDYNTVFIHKVSSPARPTGGHDFNGAAYGRIASFPEIDSYFANHLTPGGTFFKFEENYPPPDDQWYKLMQAQRVEQDHAKRISIIQDFQRYAAGKNFIISHPGQATTFSLAWPWSRNFGSFQSRGWVVDQDLFRWLDKSKM